MTEKPKLVPKGEAAVIEQFKPKKNCVELYQYEWNHETDKEDLIVAFSYEDIKGYQLNGPYVVVSLQDDTTFVHKADIFPVIKLFTKE